MTQYHLIEQTKYVWKTYLTENMNKKNANDNEI